MKKFFYLIILCCSLAVISCKNDASEDKFSETNVVEASPETSAPEGNGEPWTEQQLLEPRDLVQLLNDPKDSLVIFSLGAGGIIPGSKDTGPSGEKEALKNLEKELETLPRDTDIVIYCGCCPFNICPNVRPAFSLLNEMDFTNHRLLNLRENIKVDWIDRGYPTAE
ncbi:rhodanese-like domain-containing protein [Salinimicrobium sp. HB62]|uniref:rhodanese-like domain-containing protein n=1 Tax=Salinimicrobium sp. HB62 TaxID=3077781 RepID=UPI002D78BDF3|nr:rhodanese-like domain-containing protein [Salinimicrobium sp. HB62]